MDGWMGGWAGGRPASRGMSFHGLHANQSINRSIMLIQIGAYLEGVKVVDEQARGPPAGGEVREHLFVT